MNYLTQQLLNEEEIEILNKNINMQKKLWEDGKKTAGSHASRVKNNLQLNRNSEISKKYSQLINKKILANPLIKSFSLPKIIHGIMFTKSSQNMSYGRHIDNPFMSSGRSDLSFTISLTNKDFYEGGELVIETINSEEEGKNSQADIVLLVDAARITNAAKAGLLQSIDSTSLENDVPDGLKDPGKEWYALTRRVRVMVANPKVVDVNKIKDYADLADPSLKGKVCLRNRKSPYNQSLVANQIVNKGESETKAWLSGMISNVSKPFFPGDIAIVRAVSKKKCGVGIVNHYYVARMLAGVNGRRDTLYARKTSVITPNPAHVNISAGGIAKYATNKSEAIKLLEFLASPEGSKGLAAPTFEHPLKEVNQNEIVKNFGEFTPDKVTVDELGENNSRAIKMMKEAGWN